MRKHALVGAACLLCIVAATACSASANDGKGAENTAAVASGDGERPPPAPAGSVPPQTAPAPVPTPADDGAPAQALSTTRDKIGDAQTCRAAMVLHIGETKVSSSQAQLRLGDDAFTRMVTMTEPAYFDSLGLPVPAPEDLRTETIITATSVYSSNGPSARDLFDGKAWTKVSLTARSENNGRPQDFRSHLALLQKAGDVREVGRETVDGVATTHYAGTISMLLIQQNSPESTGISEKEYDLLRGVWEALGFDNARIELWIGPDGLPVRQTTTTNLRKPGGPTTMTTDARYSDWGTSIDDSLPPAQDTADIGTVAPALGAPAPTSP